MSSASNSRKMAPQVRSLSLVISLVILNSIPVHSQELELGAHPPQFTGPLSSNSKNHFVQLIEGPANRFTLECKVKAVPKADIVWYKDETVIEDLEGITNPTPDILEFSGTKCCILTLKCNEAPPGGILYELKSCDHLSQFFES